MCSILTVSAETKPGGGGGGGTDGGKTEQEEQQGARWEELDRASPPREPLSPELAMLDSKVRRFPMEWQLSACSISCHAHRHWGSHTTREWCRGSQDGRRGGASTQKWMPAPSLDSPPSSLPSRPCVCQ